jgi:hypothetical protein
MLRMWSNLVMLCLNVIEPLGLFFKSLEIKNNIIY